MKVINGKEILYKEHFGLFAKPHLIDYIKTHSDLLETKLKIYVRLVLDLDKCVYIPYERYGALEQLALQNALKVQAVYYCDDCVFLKCC